MLFVTLAIVTLTILGTSPAHAQWKDNVSTDVIYCGHYYSCDCSDEDILNSETLTKVILKGNGHAHVVYMRNGTDILYIVLNGTDDNSRLIIKNKSKGSLIIVSKIKADGPIKLIKGKDVVLFGSLRSEHKIGIVELAVVDSTARIIAPRIGKVNVEGSFSGYMILTDKSLSDKDLVLGELTIGGDIYESRILISGNVGLVKVKGYWGRGITMAVGVEEGPDGRFFTKDDVLTGGSINNLQVNLHKTENRGSAFGIIAGEIKKSKLGMPVKDGDFRIMESWDIWQY